jgi:hypothetical protein
MDVTEPGMVPPARRGSVDVAICVIASVLSLFFLQVTFAGGYTLPLIIGGVCGLLAARVAFGLARARRGWRAWGWMGFGVLAVLNVAAQAPRYAGTVARFIE